MDELSVRPLPRALLQVTGKSALVSFLLTSVPGKLAHRC